MDWGWQLELGMGMGELGSSRSGDATKDEVAVLHPGGGLQVVVGNEARDLGAGLEAPDDGRPADVDADDARRQAFGAVVDGNDRHGVGGAVAVEAALQGQRALAQHHDRPALRVQHVLGRGRARHQAAVAAGAVAGRVPARIARQRDGGVGPGRAHRALARHHHHHRRWIRHRAVAVGGAVAGRRGAIASELTLARSHSQSRPWLSLLLLSRSSSLAASNTWPLSITSKTIIRWLGVVGRESYRRR